MIRSALAATGSAAVASAVVRLTEMQLDLAGTLGGVAFHVSGTLGVWILVFLLVLLGQVFSEERRR